MILLTTATQINSLIRLINKLTRNVNNNPSILNHIWTNQLYNTFNGIFLLDITDHYQIFTIAPINRPQKWIRVKFRDHSGQNLAKLKFDVEQYLNNHVQINQNVSANTNNFCNNIFVIYSQCCSIKEKEISFTRLRKPWISDAIMISLNRKQELFRQYKNGTVSFDHYNSFKKQFHNYSTSCRNNYFQRKFTECSNNSRDTWKALNSLIRHKNTSKDVILNHGGSTVTTHQPLQKDLITIFQT